MNKTFPLLLILLLGYYPLYAQLGFCEGSKGEPIFHEDFENISGPLPISITNYRYISGYDPEDGAYAISSEIGQTNTSWHTYFPATTISNGRALVVNANDVTSGKFYEKQISGLCENTSYEFSAFLINVYNASHPACGFNDIPINVRFEIWDETGTVKLKEGSTGDIPSTSTPQWKQHAMTFQSQAGQDVVILRMFNNGVGGCGNDLAIDDIIFSSCGDYTEITSDVTQDNPYVVCESSVPVSLTLTATPDFSVYSQHAYQWQESEDQQTWNDLPGETNQRFDTPLLSSSRYYRVKVAEDPVNLGNNLCSSASEAYVISVSPTPQAPLSLGDVVICGNEEITALMVDVESDELVNWYDAPENGNLIAEGTAYYLPSQEGTFYAEAVKENANCEAGPRTAVRLIKNEVPEVADQSLRLCSQGVVQLDSGVDNLQYQWSTGAVTRQIEVNAPGNFSVTITTADGCEVNKNFEVKQVEMAAFEDISSQEQAVIITPANEGAFEYSLDGINYQLSNTFDPVEGGIYTAYIRDVSGCNTVSQEFPHIVIPRFITPNNDGHNDSFRLDGIEYFTSSSISIFDRYGKLIITGSGVNFSWDGTLNGRTLAAEDYWYEISIEGFKPITGHVSLRR